MVLSAVDAIELLKQSKVDVAIVGKQLANPGGLPDEERADACARLNAAVARIDQVLASAPSLQE